MNNCGRVDLTIAPDKSPPFGGGAPTGRRGPRGNLSQPAAEELVSSAAAGAVGAKPVVSGFCPIMRGLPRAMLAPDESFGKTENITLIDNFSLKMRYRNLDKITV